MSSFDRRMDRLLGLGSFGGLKIISSPAALEKSRERLFAESRHRSKRIHKKLVKRHGGEFRMVPCMWRAGDTIIAHPVMYARLQAEMSS